MEGGAKGMGAHKRREEERRDTGGDGEKKER